MLMLLWSGRRADWYACVLLCYWVWLTCLDQDLVNHIGVFKHILWCVMLRIGVQYDGMYV